MNEVIALLLTLIAGSLLGVFFYGGLWWTILKGMTSPQPALWFFGSLLIRMSVAIIGLFLVADGHWDRLLVCLIGFVMARVVVTWRTQPMRELRILSCKEVPHAH